MQSRGQQPVKKEAARFSCYQTHKFATSHKHLSQQNQLPVRKLLRSVGIFFVVSMFKTLNYSFRCYMMVSYKLRSSWLKLEDPALLINLLTAPKKSKNNLARYELKTFPATSLRNNLGAHKLFGLLKGQYQNSWACRQTKQK